MVTFEKLISDIGFNASEKTEIISFASDKYKTEVIDFANKLVFDNLWKPLYEKAITSYDYGMASLVAIINKAVSAWDKYVEMGVSYDIYSDTMSDICVWARNYRRIYGYLGFSELEWLDGSVNLRRFKLGRLQYNFGHFEASDDHDISLDIPNGSRMIEIHIQQDGPFDDEICGRSLKMAEEFFKKHYPNEDFRGFICHSWLLSPTLSAVLDETSNIIKFGERFTIVKHEVENDKQAIERIFGEKFKDKDFKPTSLQIKARKHLDEGGHLGNALGVILF